MTWFDGHAFMQVQCQLFYMGKHIVTLFCGLARYQDIHVERLYPKEQFWLQFCQ